MPIIGYNDIFILANIESRRHLRRLKEITCTRDVCEWLSRPDRDIHYLRFLSAFTRNKLTYDLYQELISVSGMSSTQANDHIQSHIVGG